jgi:hypothetical protein
MNQFTLTRVVALSALGFLFLINSCNSPREYLSIAEAVNNKKYIDAIKLANKGIQREPNNMEMHYYKLYALNELARIMPKPQQRTPVYKDFAKTFAKTNIVWKKENKKLQLNNLHALRLDAWNREFNLMAKLSDDCRSGKSSDWQSVYYYAKNLQAINDDSVRAIPIEAESLVELKQMSSLDSLLNRYEGVYSNQNWYMSAKIMVYINNREAEKALELLSKIEGKLVPDEIVAAVLDSYTNLDGILNGITAILPKGTPTTLFNQFVALILWESILDSSVIDPKFYLAAYTAYSLDKDELSTADELTLKTNIIDYILSSFTEEEMDFDRTTYTARIYTNIGIKYATLAEKSVGPDKVGYEEDTKYFLDKAMVEWEILLDEFKIDRKNLAATMYKIYLLMGDELTAGELKKEFSL